MLLRLSERNIEVCIEKSRLAMDWGMNVLKIDELKKKKRVSTRTVIYSISSFAFLTFTFEGTFRVDTSRVFMTVMNV